MWVAPVGSREGSLATCNGSEGSGVPAGAWRPGDVLESPSPQTHVSLPTLWRPGCWLCGPLMQMKKGNTMQQFLQKALEILRKDFSELR